MSATGGSLEEPPSSRAHQWAGLLATGLATGLALTVMYVADAGFFLTKDKANQYLPVARDIGRRLLAGEWLPVIDPNLGPAGNYSLDIQYGIFDPVHLLVALAEASIGDLVLGAFLWALVFEAVFAVGTAALCQRLEMRPSWAAAAGVSAALSGWVLFKLAPTWIPGLVSIAWLPWLWWSWTGGERRPRARDCMGIAVFSYLVIAGGWPATWLALCSLLAGVVLETMVRREPSVPLGRLCESIGVRLLAVFTGVVVGALNVLPLYNALLFTARNRTVHNNDFLTANLADLLAFAAPQLRGDILNFGDVVTSTIPIYFAVWFAVVVLWTVRWDRVLWRQPGLVTCAVGGSAMVLFTQAPSAVGPLRDQIRELAGVQFFFAVGVCALAGAGRWVVTRGRVTGIIVSLLAMGWLSWARNPGGMTRLGAILAVIAAAALLLVVATRSERLAGATALATTLALTLVAFAVVWANTSNTTPLRETAGRLALTRADEPIFALAGSGNEQTWARSQQDGVGHAFADLRAGARIAPGYSSIGQRYFQRLFCTVSMGTGCPTEAARLFGREATTGMSWADLLGYRTIVVARSANQAFERAAPPQWRVVGTGVEFTEYRRAGPIAVAGRITDVLGRADVTATSVSNEQQTYQVTAETAARLVFRDLYWPGYVATLNGHRIPVVPLDRTLVSLRLSAGESGTLEVSYVPLSKRALIGLPCLSVVLLAAACGWAHGLRRRWS